jgi:hypothetical protein
MSAQLLATLVLNTAKIREDSYDHEAAQASTDASTSGLVDYAKFYKLGLDESATMAANLLQCPDLKQPAFLLLYSNWNDALEWAESIDTAQA